MDQEERKARISAIQYILDNGLYSNDMKDEIYEEMRSLQANKEPNTDHSTRDYEVTDTTTADDILEDRGKQYGSFNIFVNNMVTIMNVLKRQHGELTGIEHKDIDNFFLTLKLLRLQTATDEDSLIDLENYAKLIRKRRSDES